MAMLARALGPGLLAFASSAHAAFLSGEALDTAADVIAIVVLIVVPIVLIAVFWLVHILPEKIAEERHHPQKDAIKTLCLLSLVFGGMLWPFAWIWAYGKPVLYKMAYGRDKHEDYYRELAEHDAQGAQLLGEDVTRLRAEIDVIAARGPLPEELRDIRQRLAEIETRVVVPAQAQG
jgi:hypothetical protein